MTVTCLCKYEGSQETRKRRRMIKDNIPTATDTVTLTNKIKKCKRRWNDELVNLVQGPASTKYFGLYRPS